MRLAMSTKTKPKETISLELAIVDAQDVLGIINKKVRDIDWVLENKKPTKKGQAEDLDTRAKRLQLVANTIEKMLNDRALANSNVVPIGEKKS
jgi:hypothetical protein